jgi:hypothetical protein
VKEHSADIAFLSDLVSDKKKKTKTKLDKDGKMIKSQAVKDLHSLVMGKTKKKKASDSPKDVKMSIKKVKQYKEDDTTAKYDQVLEADTILSQQPEQKKETFIEPIPKVQEP